MCISPPTCFGLFVHLLPRSVQISCYFCLIFLRSVNIKNSSISSGFIAENYSIIPGVCRFDSVKISSIPFIRDHSPEVFTSAQHFYMNALEVLSRSGPVQIPTSSPQTLVPHITHRCHGRQHPDFALYENQIVFLEEYMPFAAYWRNCSLQERYFNLSVTLSGHTIGSSHGLSRRSILDKESTANTLSYPAGRLEDNLVDLLPRGK